MLAHVCRRWRSVVFQSPLRLNLRLLCTSKTRAKDTLNIWPLLPLIINVHDDYRHRTSGVDNIIAALEHNDRVRQIYLGWISSPEWRYVTCSAALQKPFPGLTHLHLGITKDDDESAIVPDSFLGGTAPRLRSLELYTFHFQDCQNYSCPPLTSSFLTFILFPVPDTFHPR